MSRQMSEVKQTIMNNDLQLRNLVLKDPVEATLLAQGQNELNQVITKSESTVGDLAQDGERARVWLEEVGAIEKYWGDNVAAPLVEKRRQLDAGNITVAELTVAYLQATSEHESKTKVEEPLGQLNTILTESLARADASDRRANVTTYAFNIVGAILMVLLGGVISWRVAKSITSPLSQLVNVARQIACAGDLEQQREVKGEDEDPELTVAVNNMGLYLREMAGVSEAIAGGDLSIEISPRSKRHTMA